MTVQQSDKTARTSDEAWQTEVMRALDSLDDPSRTAIRLVYADGLTQAQIADRLSLPQASVRGQIARGMRELAERLTAGTMLAP